MLSIDISLCGTELGFLVSKCNVCWVDIRQEIKEDAPLGHILADSQWVLSKVSSHVPQRLHKYNATALGDHNRECKTYLRIAVNWFWDGIRRQANQFVRMHCESATDTSLLQHAGLLHPHFVPPLVWDDIIMYLFDYMDSHSLLILIETRS